VVVEGAHTPVVVAALVAQEAVQEPSALVPTSLAWALGHEAWRERAASWLSSPLASHDASARKRQQKPRPAQPPWKQPPAPQ
jgi:hypothetical protein